MQKSKSEKIKSVLKHLIWILNIASKFMPAKLRVSVVAFSTIAGGLVALLERCDQSENPPASPSKIQKEEPKETPSANPTKIPLPEIRNRSMVRVGETFLVQLCNIGNKHGISLYADQYRLGYFGFGIPCMNLQITLNQKGQRKLIAEDDSGLRVISSVIVQ
jgi:hypothetical protein